APANRTPAISQRRGSNPYILLCLGILYATMEISVCIYDSTPMGEVVMVDLLHSEPPPQSLEQGPKLSPGPAFSASARLSIMQNQVFAHSSVAVVIAGAVILVVAVVVTTLWTGIGNADISPAGWLVMGFGVIVTLALGIG